MHRHSRTLATLLALGAALAAPPAGAQSASEAPAAPDPSIVAPPAAEAPAASAATPSAEAPSAEAPSAAAVSRESLVAGVRRPAVAGAAANEGALAARPTRSQARALAIVGGAAFVLGVILGDDIGTLFMVGGGVTGLVGLYYWLQ